MKNTILLRTITEEERNRINEQVIALLAGSQSTKTTVITFDESVGGFNIKGEIGIANPIENSYIQGSVSGLGEGDFRLDRNNSEVKIGPDSIYIKLEANFGSRKLEGKICTLFGCSDPVEILAW